MAREGTRAARGEDGKTYPIPADMKYNEWKEYFVDKAKDPADWLKKARPEQKISLNEKIQKIKDQIAKNKGIIEESHLQEAGKAVQEELKNSDHFKNVLKIRAERDSMYAKWKEANKKYADFNEENPELCDAYLSYDFWKERCDECPSSNQFKQAMLQCEQKLKNFDPNLVSKCQKLIKESDNFHDKWDELKAEYDKINSVYSHADNVKKILSQVREMGSEGIKVTSHLKKSKSPMRKVIEDAYNHYPKDWVQVSVQSGKLTIKTTTDRGYYSHSKEEIAIIGYSDNGRFETAIHELGHRMEWVVSGIKPSEKVFYDRRTAGEELVWLGGGYKTTEVGRKDHFIDPYMGKDYGGWAYELVSMGFEYAYSKPETLMADEDMANWIYGLLCLY